MAAQNNTPIGWGYFASIMMVVLGAFEVIAGLAGIFKDKFYLVGQNGLLLFNFRTWGWISLVLGIVALMTGLELMRGAMWAKMFTVFLAVISLVANMAFFNAYPWWSFMMMIVDLFIIYALSVRGGEMR